MSTPDLARLDFFELGDKTSLICADPLTTENVRSTLKAQGYKSHTAETSEMAIERLRYTAYDIVIIHENFAGSSLRSNALLSYLATLPMAQRRNSFVCLIGDSFKTLDAMQAFAQSVHVVVNPLDMPNFAAILRKSVAEFELLYKVYKDAVEASTGR
jgi:DNA-binding NarL/FixJ family response regulator